MNESQQHPEGFRLSRQQADAIDAERRVGHALRLCGTRRFEGRVELPRLAAAFERVCARHEILRTVFRAVPGLELPLQVIEATPTYRLAEAPPTGPGEPVLSVSVCHSERGSEVSVMAPPSHLDEGSMEALLAELESTYADREPGEHPLQYVDYSEWQHDLVQSDWGRQAQSFWASQPGPDAMAAPLPFESALPLEHEAAAGPAIGVVELRFERLRPALERLGSALEATTRDALFCIWAAFAARAFGRNEVTIAVMVDKQEAELAGTLGRFARRIPVPLKFDPSASSRQGFTLAQARLAECLAWREAFVESAYFGPAMKRASPALGFRHRERATAGDSQRTRVELDPTGSERLRLELVTGADGNAVRLQYRADSFERATVEVWAEQLATFAGELGDLGQPLRRVSWLGDAERRRLLETFVGNPRPAPDEPVFLHHLFEAAAREHPERPAIVHAEVALSYGALERRAEQVASQLLAQGVGCEEVVAVYAGRSCELIVALLGILKAGAAYLPLDPSYPAERLRGMVDDARVRRVLFLTPDDVPPELGAAESISLAQGSPTWETGNAALPVALPTALPASASTSRLAYLIYTSGSTGKPKGVMVSHANAVASTRARFGFYDWDVECFLLLSSVSFDSSVAGIFWTLGSGGCLCLPEDGQHKDASSIAELIRRRGVTHLLTLPSFYEQLLGELGESRVRGVIVAGEACPAALVRRHFETLSQVALVNEYGPTEGTVWSTAWRMRAGDSGPVPIGGPIETMRAYVLDAALELAPIGATGELFIAGHGITRGYFGRPSLTAERFLPDPHGRAGERMYRTGDSVRFRPDAALEFLGRVDQQVKLRGYRIELGEIEARILEHAEIAEAAVALRELVPGQGRLLAYVVPAQRTAASDAEAWRGLEQRLREHLSSRLPEFMQPAHWMALEAFPETPNGKLDRAALPAPAREGTSEHVAPRDEVEQRLADTWKQVLQVERVGVHDNFFQLGGDSIVLLQVVALARQRGLQLTARDVFGHPTVAELAAFIGAGSLAGPADKPLDAELPLSPAQRWFFGEHSAAPDAQSQWRSFEPSERLDPQRLERCLRQLCELHDALRLSFVRGVDGAWRQAQVSPLVLHERWAAAPLLELVALSDRGELPARIEAARARLRLDEGRLLGALLVELGGVQQLVLIVHRLVVDPASWQLLAADLGALYRDSERDRASLMMKTSSLASLAEALARRAADPGLAAELEHWQSQRFDARSEHFPRDHELAEYSSELAGFRMDLDAELSASLLERVCPRRRVGLEPVLLAAFVRVLCRYGRKSSVVVAVERARATRPFDGLELSRSVGWLSSHFPLRVRPELHGISSGLSSVAHIKRELARVPGNGAGYGVAKYLAARDAAGSLADAAWPRAAFSFRGHDTTPDALLRSSALEGPLDAGAPGAWLSLEATRVDARLNLSWVYQPALYREETLAALARELCAELEALAARAAAEPPPPVEPGDFPLARLGRAELEALALDWAEIEDVFPLSPMQQGMLLHTLLEPRSGIYLMQDHYQIDSAVDAAKLVCAWREVARRHPALRAQFVWQADGNMLQAIRRELPVPLALLDYRGLDAAAQQRQLEAELTRERERGFDMSLAPLWALRLVRLGEERYELVISHHHVIMDGWSWGLVWLDVCAVYQDALGGKPLARPEAPSYREFIAWLGEKDPEAAARYWRGALTGFEQATPLPFDRAPAPDANGSSIDAVRSTWSLAETGALTELVARQGLTTNTFVQAAWALTLSRYSGRREVLFGVTVAGRPPELPELQRAVGLFINTIPLRLRLPEGRVRVADFLQSLLQQNVEMRQYEHLPLVRVQALSAVPKSEPLFHSLLVYENVPLDSSLLPQAQSLRVRAGASRVHTNYPLTLMVLPGRELGLDLSFDERFFERATVARMLAEIERWLRALIAGFDRPLSELTGASAAERRQLLGCGRGPERPVPDERGYAALLLERARSTPERVVACCAGESMTYAELEARSAFVAAGLEARGLPLEARVGVLVERGVELLAFAIGVLRAGAIYVPLDPSHPPERLARTAKRARLGVVLCSPASAQKLAAGLEALPSASSLELWAPPATAVAERRLCSDARYAGARSVAYVIHTSGSTGEPKGAMVEHAGMLNNVLGKVSDLGLTETDVIAQTASAAFDISVWQLLTGPVCGARLEIVPDAIAQDPRALLGHVQATGVTVLESVPSLIEALLSEPAAPLPSLRWMITTGEAMSPELARRWRERYPDVGLLNAYGPAECADDVALCRIEASSEQRMYLPIGRATDNNRLYVLDASLELVPFGATGELCIAGVGPGRGYLDAPGHTARVFVPNPFPEQAGERLYRTGDLVRFETDGSLAFVGRTDHQVKIRGYRVELGEIEARLREHPAVQECVVIAKDGAQGKRLVAYLVAAAEREARPAEIKEHLSRLLPRYMLPAFSVVLERFPLNDNGKLDRKALPEPELGTDDSRASHSPPCTPLETAIAEIWCEVLALERVGRHADFFELGGHSLLAVQVVSRLRRRTGRDVPLRALFDRSELAAFAARVEETTGHARPLARSLEVIEPAPRDRALPLSHAQQRLWFLWCLEPQSAAYHLPLALRIRGDLDRALLERCFEVLIARHEGLRTRFAPSGDGAVQVIEPPRAVGLELEDLSALEPTEREAAAQALAQREATRPFDLERGPLLRVKLATLGQEQGNQEHLLLVTMHHIISDEESMRVLVEEFLVLYEAGRERRRPTLAPLPVQYVDFALWQRRWLAAGELERQLGYWRARLGDEHPVLELPADRPRPSAPSGAGASVSFELDPSLGARLRERARAEGVTPFMLLLAAFQLLLFRYSGQRQIRVGVPNANRNRVEIERSVGFFVNTQVLAAELAPELAFDALLGAVKSAALEAQSHQDLPFEQLVDALNPPRSLSHTPLFQVMFNHLVAERRPLRSLPGLSLEPFDTGGQTSQFDLTLDVAEGSDGIVACAFSYATDLFDPWRIEQLGRHFVCVLEQALEHPQRKLAEFELVSAASGERRALLGQGRGPERRVPDERGYAALLLERARSTPERLVACCAGESSTYGHLEARSEFIAAGLEARGVPLEGRVGVLVERGLELLAFAVGVLRAGAIYVPLDPTHPPERLARTLLRARIKVVLCSVQSGSKLAGALEATGSATALELWAPPPTLRGERRAFHVARYAGPRSIAYVIHTSGSTGEPKGAMVEHAGMLNNVLGKVTDLGLTEADVIAQTASAAFDISVWQLLTGPLCGARLEIVPDAIAQDPRALLGHVQATGITVLESVPSLIEALLSGPAAPLPSLRWLITTGEAMSPELARRWRERYPDVGLLNAYGPAECADDVALCRIEASGEARQYLPIGRATDNNRLYVLDANLELVPFGLTGELCIAGIGPGRGYLDAPGHTAGAFVPNPYAEQAGERLYRTGDRVRIEPDGSLVFVGRADHQVKIRGYRVELGEIEARLREHPAVQECVVVVKDGAQGKRLVAYVVAATDVTADPAQIAEHLSRQLPRFMVPAQIVVLERLPLNSNGKLDRKALPEPSLGASSAREAYLPPSTPLERLLAEIWCEVLGLERVGRHDDFFELGGHSLLGAKMISRVQRRTGRDVPLRVLFEQSELTQFAERVLAAPLDEKLAGKLGQSP